MSIDGPLPAPPSIPLDRLPVALATMLCAVAAYSWTHLPQAPAAAEALPTFAAKLAEFTRRERLWIFPLGVATSIATLVVLFRHGVLASGRGVLQGTAAAVLFCSGLFSMFVTDPLAREIARQTGDGEIDRLAPLVDRWASGHSLQLLLAVVVLGCLTAARRQPEPPPSSSSARDLTARHRTLLFLLGSATLFQGYDTFIVSMALPYIGRDLSASEASLGFALSIIRVGALASVVFGRIADRYGRRRMLLATILAYTVATAATGLSQGIGEFVVLQLFAQIFLVTELSLAQVVVTEEFPLSFRSRGQGMLGAFGALGAGLAAMLFPAFQASAFGWRGLYFLGVAPLLFVAFLRRSMPETARWQSAHRRGETERASGADLIAHETRGRFFLLLALGFALGVCVSPAFSFASYRATNAFGWSPTEVSAMVLLGGGLGTGGWFVFGSLAERLGRRAVGVTAFAGTGIAAALFYRSRWLGPAYAALVFTEAGAMVALNALGTELFPTRLRSTAKSWITNATVVGAVTGMAAVGLFGSPAGGTDRVIALAALMPVLLSATVALLPETRGLELEEIAAD
jgi:putative MFS transporter